MKGHGLAATPPAGADLWDSRWFATGLVAFEAALGWWLVLGVFPHPARWVAVTSFAGYFCVALAEGLAGKQSCGCFGAVLALSPWVMATFDAAAVTALFLIRPAAQQRPTAHTWLALATFPLPPAVAVVLFGAGYRPPALAVMPNKVTWGVLRASDSRQATVLVKNDSQRLVELDKLETTCPCLSGQLTERAIPPGGEVALCVRLDLNREPTASGAFRVLMWGRAHGGEVGFMLPVEFFVLDGRTPDGRGIEGIRRGGLPAVACQEHPDE